MANSHTVHLNIDSTTAEAGARKFRGAVESIKKALQGLDRDADGVFQTLKKSTDMPSTSGRGAKAAITQISSAARTAETQVATLQRQLNRVGNAAGITKTTDALADFRAEIASSVTSTDDLRQAKDRLAASLHEVREEARSTAEVERLTTAYQRQMAALDPVATGTHAYRRAVMAIEQAHGAGVISTTEMTAALKKAEKAYISAGAAADNANAQQARLFGSRAGWGQNFDLRGTMMQLSQVAQQGSVTGNYLGALGTQLPDLALAFGPVGIAAGAVGGILLSTFAPALLQSKNDGDALKETLEALSTSTDTYEAAARRAIAPIEDLKKKFGEAATAVRDSQRALTEHAQLTALKDAQSAAKQLASQYEGLFKRIFYADEVKDDPIKKNLDSIQAAGKRARAELGLTTEGAEKLKSALDDLANNDASAKDIADDFTRLNTVLGELYGDIRNMPEPVREFHKQLQEAHIDTREIEATQRAVERETRGAASAADLLNTQLSFAVGSSAALAQNLSSISTFLGAGFTVNVPTPRPTSDLSTAAGDDDLKGGAGNDDLSGGGILNPKLSFTTSDQDRLNGAVREARKLKEGQTSSTRAHTAALTANTSALGASTTATQTSTSALKERLKALETEAVALRLSASGQYENRSAAQLMAQAMAESKGQVDEQTASLIAQIDAAETLNRSLERLARDPVKEWRDSVPTWTEAAKEIEAGALNSLSSAISDMIKTGKADMEALGDAVLGVFADVIADKAVAELHDLLTGGKEGGTVLGGLLSGFRKRGDKEDDAGVSAALSTGSQAAGQTIATSMVQAGNQVASSISTAIGQAGATAANSQRTGIQLGGQSAATSQRIAGVQNGQMIRQATQQGGSTHATTVQRAIVSGGQTHATMVGAASSGSQVPGAPSGDQTGQILGQILGMVVGSLAEGGYSTAAPATTTAPISAFRNAPHFSQGGITSGGIPAILHANEAVVPLSKGRKIPVDLGDGGGGKGGSTVQNYAPTFNISTPDVEGFRRAQKQVEKDAFASGQKDFQRNS